MYMDTYEFSQLEGKIFPIYKISVFKKFSS